MLKPGDRIKVHIYCSTGREIKTRCFNRVFEVKKVGRAYGIDWNFENKENPFTEFSGFSHTVIFESVEDGKKYHYSNFINDIEEV